MVAAPRGDVSVGIVQAPADPSAVARLHLPQRRTLNGSRAGEVIADELVRIDDDRLTLVTITSVDVDAEMNRGIVYYDSLEGVEGDEQILKVLGEHRKRLQSAIATQVHARRTPILEFRPDEAIRAAERIDEVLRNDPMRTRNHDDKPE